MSIRLFAASFASRRLVPALLIPLALAACSAGNSGDNQSATGDGPIPTGINRFLVFPNPVVSAGTFETTSSANAAAYYRAVDATSQRDTLARFRAINGFGTGGQEHAVVFRDVRDLGYGRRLTGRLNAGGDIAFIVENYNVSVLPGAYSTLNAEAAVAADPKWHIGTNGIEYSATPCDAAKDPAACDPTVRFAKFYNYDPVTGARNLIINLDGRGDKAMPGPCITCHGGRGDPLTPSDAGGQPRFPFVGNSASKKRGDTLAHLQPFNVDTFQFSTAAGFSRADQEAKFKDFNLWVLCSFPLVGAAAGPEDNCRRAATADEWQGTAAEMLKAWYGGPGMPTAVYVDNYVPTLWQAGNVGAPAENLYKQVVAPYCRTCHIQRGNAHQSDIDFTSKAKFDGYADRIKAHVFDRGNMPLAFIVYDDFWRSSAPTQLARYLESLGVGIIATSGGEALRPGRPVADPGPTRMVRAATNAALSGTNSLFATSYSWAVVSSPGGGNAVITNPTAATATFQASTLGDYGVRLTVRNGSGASDSKTITVTVDASFPDPASIRFASVKNILRNVVHPGGTCISCHIDGAATTTPVAYTDIDRDGVGGVTATDDAWFYKELVGRVNLTEIIDSPLLRKPTGNHHGGGAPIVLTGGSPPPGLSNFSKVYYWILNGMPTGGVAANAGANSTNNVTFSGGTADIVLSATGSLGATSYTWTILAGGPAGSSIVNANAGTGDATLRVQNVGTYTVQLQVTDGTSTDTATRTITVTETAVVASFTPSGNVAVTFVGAPLTGPITLTNTSTGNPTTCLWTIVSGPAGASLGNAASCTTTTLTVPATAVGGTYQISFNGANVSTNDTATNPITGLSAGSGVTANAGADSTNALTFSNSLGTSSTAGAPVSTVALDGTASTGPGILTYAWTVTSGPAGSSITNANQSTATLNVATVGTYNVQLVVDNGLPQGAGNTATRTITVSAAANATFTNIATVFGNLGCTGCHVAGNDEPGVNSGVAPAWTNPPAGLYTRVFNRVDTGSPTSSLLLLNPSNNGSAPNTVGAGAGHHGGGLRSGFDHGGNDFATYDQFLTWIVNGAPNN